MAEMSRDRLLGSLVKLGPLVDIDKSGNIIHHQLLSQDVAGAPQLDKLQQPGFYPGYEAKKRQDNRPLTAQNLLHGVEMGLQHTTLP